ncbi:hypothetical protein ACF0H5_016777 [Mactra antiquata]
MFFLKLTILVTVAAVGVIACPSGFETWTEFCYKLLPVKASWAEAMQYCQAIGSSLAVISNNDEENFIEGYLHRVQTNISTSQIWIGGTDLLQEGVWMAPFSREPLTYFNWAGGEPDNLGGQHCLAIFNVASLQWDDNLCEVHNYALCKMENEDIGVVGK